MTLGVRGRLFAVSLVLILIVGLTSGIYLERALRGWLGARIEGELSRHARTTRALVELSGPADDIAGVDPIADRLGDTTPARVTVIAPDGAVLGDSELDPDQVAEVDNHGARPEVQAALAEGKGVSRRYSTTVRTDMLYVAAPYDGPRGRGVVRVAMPLSEIDRAVGRLRLVMLVAGLVGLALAVFMSGLASQLATRAVRQLVASARTVAKGEGIRRLPASSSDELGRLAGSFNQVVAEFDRAVAALAGERDHLETILDGMSEGVLAVDAEQRITRMNRAALALFGLAAPPTGKPLIETIRIPALVELVAARPVSEDGTAEFMLPGAPSPARSVQAAVRQLQTGGCVVVMRDVTRTRRLETVRRDFVANVSHELRTPVTVIRANAETLVDGAIDDAGDRERARSFALAIARNAERLSRIIADLLDLSRIEAGEYELRREPVALAPLIRRVSESLEAPARANAMTVAIEVPEQAEAHADARAVEQVVFNLLDNALKYAGQGRGIAVRVNVEGDGADGANGRTIRVEVEDDGPGIEARHRARVFERFYRVDPGRSREMGGTGLGLSIVKHLVQSMDGEVGFRPGSPRGSVFWFTVPAA